MDRIYKIKNTSLDLENVKSIKSIILSRSKQYSLKIYFKANGQYIKNPDGEVELQSISDDISIDFPNEAALNEAHLELESNWNHYLKYK